MDKELSRCQKLEDKGLRVLFAGYYKREEQLREQYEAAINQYDKLLNEKDIFTVLESQEARSLKTRLLEAHQAVAMQEAKENELQVRYAQLRAEKEKMEKMLELVKGN